ncbi:MAG: hypothetical protein A3H49_04540 [Nitrospirae bacterium RIFCSPLOWO2_02_FULL_62_14]|nr:MAG: hypothetical protein A3H49_04540 [Nitrospirae bacterium RIFCSPLOWO2_02_FULL_62_14]
MRSSLRVFSRLLKILLSTLKRGNGKRSRMARNSLQDVQKGRFLTRPAPARQDAPFPEARPHERKSRRYIPSFA